MLHCIASFRAHLKEKNQLQELVLEQCWTYILNPKPNLMLVWGIWYTMLMTGLTDYMCDFRIVTDIPGSIAQSNQGICSI
jgi:hypothetical protein